MLPTCFSHLMLPSGSLPNPLLGPDSAICVAKNALAQVAMLVHIDSSADTFIVTDTSDRAVGASLEQFIQEKWQPLVFFSATLHTAETSYSAFDKELLAAYLAVKHFSIWLPLHPLHGHGPQTIDLCHEDKQKIRTHLVKRVLSVNQ